MPREPKSKNYILDAEDVHLAREFDAILKSYEDKADALQALFKKEMDALNENCKAEASRAWFVLAKAVGLDAVATWGDQDYALDRTYLDEGFAAIRYIKMEPHPLMGMFGGPPPGMDEDEDPEAVKVPPKEKLN